MLVLDRFHDALMSVYLYNEHRGYTQLDALEAALRRVRPSERELVAAISAHARDERRHYRMFRAWFVRRGVMPLRVDAAFGYIDRLVRAVTGETLDAIDLDAAVADDATLRRLFRLVVLTEQRGLAQVRSLLQWAPLVFDRDMRAMFEVVERDEPSHFVPYQHWLAQRHSATSNIRERLIDICTHALIVGAGFPLLLCDPRVPRLDVFPA